MVAQVAWRGSPGSLALARDVRGSWMCWATSDLVLLCRARRYTSQDAVIQQAKLFLKTENEQVRHRAQRPSQSSSPPPSQEDGWTEEMKMGQVGGWSGVPSRSCCTKCTPHLSHCPLSPRLEVLLLRR